MCPICFNQDKKNISKSFLPHYFQCNKCKGFFLHEKKQPVYSQKYFQDKTNQSVVSKIITPILRSFLNKKIDMIIDLSNKKNPNILDYGCGKGEIIKQLVARKINAKGYEPSIGAIELTKKERLPVSNKLNFKKKYFDLIMFWHSLEHIDQPTKTMTKLTNYLKKDGKILIAVPNGDSFNARLAKDKWFHYSYPLHRIHFTPSSIKYLLNKANLKLIRIDYLNPEYTISGLIQSFLNFFLPKDVFYAVVSHRRLYMPPNKATIFAIISIFILIVFSPILIIYFLLELIFKKTDAMLITAQNIQYEKTDKV